MHWIAAMMALGSSLASAQPREPARPSRSREAEEAQRRGSESDRDRDRNIDAARQALDPPKPPVPPAENLSLPPTPRPLDPPGPNLLVLPPLKLRSSLRGSMHGDLGWQLLNPRFSQQVIESARQRTLSERLVIDFVRHRESLRHDAQFEPAQAAVVEQALALASDGDSGVARLGTETDMVYVNTGDRIDVIDPVRREILNIPEERANAMLGASLQEHVSQQPPGVRFFSAYPTKTDDLVFMIEHKRLKIAKGELTQDHIRALADVLLSTAPAEGDVIFTVQPQLSAEHRGRIRDILFQVAGEASSRGRRVLMDDLSTTTLQRAATIRNAKLQDSMVAFVADGSFNVSDAKVVQNLEEELVAGGIRVVHVDADGVIAPSAESVAVVITGHSDDAFGRFVEDLISRNALRDKMVIINSCGTKLTQELAGKMIHRGGSIGVYQFQGTIRASQVRGFVRQVLQSRQDGSEPALMNAVEQSSMSHQLKGLWQISRAEHRSTRRDKHV